MIVLFLRPDENNLAAWASALQDVEPATTVVAAWELAVALTETCENASPMDEEMFEFLRMHQDPGPTVLSPAIRELLQDARLIVNDHVKPKGVWCKNIKRFATNAKVQCIKPDADPADLAEALTI